MKTIASVIIAVALFASAPFAVAGPYKSVVISHNDPTFTLEVPVRKAFIITAFTQNVAGQAGALGLSVTINGKTTNILQATFPDGDSKKDLVIAGPATIEIVPNSQAGDIYLSYKVVAN